jgi:hypothetical protein
MTTSTASIVKLIALAAFAVAIWALAKYGQAMPRVAPADAPKTEFSAMRADAVLARLLGPEKPHPASTAENARVRARIVKEFARLGVTAKTYTAMGCNAWERGGFLGCATVTDVIAPVLPGEGKAIVLLAHYDSVPAGPGAADDESGVATVLETARALRARGGRTLHPVIAVLTDGEEYGLLGAAAFLDNPQLKDQVGAVVNVEARGSNGQSLLFQTSPGNEKLIDLYAASVPDYATSSLYEEIYKRLPNDTDLTLFIRDGFPSFNFAFAGRVADYHTPLDTRRNLGLATLQQHGDNVLGVAGALMRTPYADLKGPDAIYVDVMGRWLIHLPQGWALPGAIVLLLLIAGAVAVSHGEPVSGWEWLKAAAVFPALVIGAGLVGWLLSFIAQLISGMPDPAYAHPVALRTALALGVAGIAIAVARFSGLRAAASAVWLWLAVLGVAVAAFLPGFSPYFLLPLAFAAVLMLATARMGWASGIGRAALVVAALAALVLWLQLAASGEVLMGLRLHPLFTLPAAVGAATLVPLLATPPLSKRVWRYAAGGCLGAALIASIVAGLQPAYSKIAPQRLNINYVVDNATGAAHWAADAMAPLPKALRDAAKFSDRPEQPFPSSPFKAYLAPAERAQTQMPGAAVLANAKTEKGRRVTLGFEGSRDAAMMTLAVPGKAGLTRIVVGEKVFAVPPEWAKRENIVISCMSRDCASMPVTLDMTETGPLKLTVVERRAGLPAFGEKLAKARGRRAVPSQFGDGMMLVTPVTVAAVK